MLGGEAGPSPLRVFFQDESRLGLHLPQPRRLTARGVKPLQPYAPLDEYYWLYAAVEPATGDAFWLEMPTLDVSVRFKPSGLAKKEHRDCGERLRGASA